MLIVTRRPGEKIQIGEDIRVDILEVKSGGSVRIGVEAPRHVKVLRSELIDDHEDQSPRVANTGR
jgi:carbon storage regulator